MTMADDAFHLKCSFRGACCGVGFWVFFEFGFFFCCCSLIFLNAQPRSAEQVEGWNQFSISDIGKKGKLNITWNLCAGLIDRCTSLGEREHFTARLEAFPEAGKMLECFSLYCDTGGAVSEVPSCMWRDGVSGRIVVRNDLELFHMKEPLKWITLKYKGCFYSVSFSWQWQVILWKLLSDVSS